MFLSLILLTTSTFVQGELNLTLKSAAYCRNCHEEQYDSWSKTMHRYALNDPVFYTAYVQALEKSGYEARVTCLSCHSPTTRITKDFYCQKSLSFEGVTCDYCHSISNITIEGNEITPVFDLKGNTKYGPEKVENKSNIAAHKIEYKEFFTRSEFCATCHQAYNDYGVPILDTYNEWKNSPYRKMGVQCQDCHMEKIKHVWAGGHGDQLLKAANVTVLVKKLSRDLVEIRVYVTNKGSGHKIPTGTPSREIYLEVNVKDENGRSILLKHFEYRRILIDQYGMELKRDHEMILKSTKVLLDNRILPKETREEKFNVSVPEGVEEISVDATLFYNYQPLLITKTPMLVRMAKDSKTIRIGEGVRFGSETEAISSHGYGLIGLILLISISFLYLMLSRPKG